MGPSLKNEPVRVIGYSATAGAILAALGAYLIAKGYTAEGGLLVTVGGIVGGVGATEGKRALTDSPATREANAPVLATLEATSLAPVLGNPPPANIAPAVATVQTPAPAGLTTAEQILSEAGGNQTHGALAADLDHNLRA